MNKSNFFRLLFIFLAIIQSSIFSLSNYNIVFVHIGEKLPTYSFEAIKQARLFNPDSNIYFLAEKKLESQIKENLFKENIEVVALESLKQSKEHLYFQKNFIKNNNFWVFTTERFFYLQEFIEERNLQKTFHLENDIMLYCCLKELLPIFENYYIDKLGLTLDHDNRCIPGFVYVDQSKPLKEFIHFLYAKKFNRKDNDMVLLAEFINKYPTYAKTLPIVPPNYSYQLGLVNSYNKKVKNPSQYFKYFERFQSIFDAAALGQYLGGTHTMGTFGFINETSCFDPSKFEYLWEKDDKMRFVPYLIFNKEKIRINNLHIHSKKLLNFYSLNPNCGKL
jgi:hypothetical protein